VISGKDCPKQASVEQVAEQTMRCLKRAVPAALPGVVFLSGGQTDEAATAHLNAFLQPRAAEPRSQGVGRQGGQRRRRAEGLLPPRPHEQLGEPGQVPTRHGKAGGVVRLRGLRV
jgi:hypothetical protein